MTYSNKFKLMAIKLYFHMKMNHKYNVISVSRLLNISKSCLYLWLNSYKNSPLSFNASTITHKLKYLKYKISHVIRNYICKICFSKKIF